MWQYGRKCPPKILGFCCCCFVISSSSTQFQTLSWLVFITAEPPSFIKKIENIYAVLKESATFQCAVAGSQPLTVSWIKDERILENDENFHITFEQNIAKLKVKKVDLSHSGRYTCQAKNEAGVEKCFALLLAQGV